MNELSVLELVLLRLEQFGIKYMLTGSMASNFYGPPRSTQDADVVIEADEQSLRQFITSLSKEFYADADSATDALKTYFMFNIVHHNTGFKVDFIIRKDDAYSALALNRRMTGKVLNVKGWFISPEDLILAKLQWYKAGESSRQLEDAMRVMKLQLAKLDMQYMKTWAAQLHVDDLLDKITAEMNNKKSDS